MSKTRNKFSPEIRERTVRMVLDHEAEYPSRWNAITSISSKIGCTAPTLNNWVKKAEIDGVVRSGVTSETTQKVKSFKREVRKLRQPNIRGRIVTEDQTEALKSKLWVVADVLRGRMNLDEYRDYMLGFIFYKYLSEKMEAYADGLLEQDNIAYASIAQDDCARLKEIKVEAVENIGFFLAPDDLFNTVADRASNPSNFILEDLRRIFRSIENTSMGTEAEHDFEGLFEDLDLSNSRLRHDEGDKNTLIAKVLTTLSGIDFNLSDTPADVLGDAYEYLIGEFAANAGKKAGEFYTPQPVSTIMTRIVATDMSNGKPTVKPEIKDVYDPTCGSGSLLLRFKREGIKIGTYYGQEINRTTFNLARMNMILHGVHYREFDLRQNDTIKYPAEEHQNKKFEAVVAAPPFSAKWSQHDRFNGDPRFSDYPHLQPASKTDYCFVMHMLHHLADNGVMAVILPHGVLFRGVAEGKIRRFFIEHKNWLDAVIGLPANIFYGTSIAACIMVFKKCREDDDDIMFIDASQHFAKIKNRNHLTDDDVNKVVTAYRNREAVERYARPVLMSEVKANDYNLNIPRYVDTSEPEEEINLDVVTATLGDIDKNLNENAIELKRFCDELGIKGPV